MVNRRRVEISAVLDGRERTLVLTLGALAELEAAFAADDLVALAGRFESGRLSARDIARIVACGLRGAGDAVSDDEVFSMRADAGAAGFARIAAELINVTFGGESGEGREAATLRRRAARLGRLMDVGLGVLRLAPAAFWAMTPKEFTAAAGGIFSSGMKAPDRTELSELMGRFPDR